MNRCPVNLHAPRTCQPVFLGPSQPAGPLPKKILELGYAYFRDEPRERLRMQESLAPACFRSLVLVNGGAIIALFSLIGSNAAIAREVPGLQLGWPLQRNRELELAGRAPTYDFEACLIAGDRWEKTAMLSVALSLGFFGLGPTLCILTFLIDNLKLGDRTKLRFGQSKGRPCLHERPSRLPYVRSGPGSSES